jgi:hypothetical protein
MKFDYIMNNFKGKPTIPTIVVGYIGFNELNN